MANFTNIQITNLGRALQAKAQAGAPLVFTRFRIGSGSMSGQQIADMTNLITPVMWLTLNKSQPSSAGRYTVGAPFSNNGITTGFYFREWGIFASDPDVGEIMYCYGNVGAGAEYIPAGGGSEIVEQQLDIITLIGNATNVSATIDQSLVFATIQQLNSHKNAAVLDHPDGSVTEAKLGTGSVTSGKLGDGAVTDVKIGNRTINDATAPTGNAGTLTNLLSWIGNMIKSITGKANWRTAPAINLEQANTEITALKTATAEGQTIPAPIVRGSNVITATQASGATFKVSGRTFANIVPPALGRCEDAAAWTNSGAGTIEVSNSIYREGNGSMKVMASADYFPWRSVNYHLDKAKTYFLGCWIYLENVGGGAPRVSITDSNSPTPIRYNAVANTSIVGQWQFCFARIPTNNVIATDNGFRLFLMSYGGPCTFYVDSIRIYELTTDEYNAIGTTITGEAIDRRWPYVDSVQHTQGLSVTLPGKNLLKGIPDAIHANAVLNAPYDLTVNATGANQASVINVPVVGGNTYTLSIVLEGANALVGRQFYNAAGQPVGSYQNILSATGVVVITVPVDAARLQLQLVRGSATSGTVCYRDWMLVLGDASNLPASFTPYNPQYAHAPIKLASNVDRTIADSYDSATGEVFRRWLTGIKLDGTRAVPNSTAYTGFKRLNITALNGTYNEADGYFVKFDGAVLKNRKGGTWESGVFQVGSADNGIYVTVSNSESGWTDGINPNENARKALLNGWRAVGNNGTVYNSWVSALTGAAPATNTEAYVAANKAPGWDAYATLDYVRATPITETLTGDLGGLSMVKGGNAVELLEGVIVREKATVSYNPNGAGFYRINVTGHPSYTPNSPLSRRAASILCVYKDTLPDDRWSFLADPYAYGSVVAQITAANYDPAAEYFVDYIVLDKYAYTANAVDATLTYQSTLGGAVAQSTVDIAGLKQHNGVQDFALDYIQASAENTALDLAELESTLGTASTRNAGNAVGQVPLVQSDGKLDQSIMPNITITDTFVIATQAAMLALTAQVGDVAVRTDLNKTFILRAFPATTLANWQELLTPPNTVLSVAGKTGAVTLVKGDITDFPSSLPANGGNADTVDGFHLDQDVRTSASPTFSGTRDIVNVATIANGQYFGDASVSSMASSCNVYDLVYRSATGYNKAVPTSDDVVPITGMCIETGTGSRRILKRGFIRNTAWAFTPGAVLYASTTVEGGMTETLPTASGSRVQIIGHAETADIIYFNPDYTVVTI